MKMGDKWLGSRGAGGISGRRKGKAPDFSGAGHVALEGRVYFASVPVFTGFFS